MKIAIASRGPGPEDMADSRFGRCEYFVVYDSETKTFQGLKNDAAEAANGAGGRAVNLIKKEGVELVLAGEVGPKASEALKTAEIKWQTGGTGTVRSLLEAQGVL
jgi:predicted Fe-Mo cluster-binding NifX family protein